MYFKMFTITYSGHEALEIKAIPSRVMGMPFDTAIGIESKNSGSYWDSTTVTD